MSEAVLPKEAVPQSPEARRPVLGFREFTRRFAVPLWPWYLAGTVLLAAVNLINLQIPQLAKAIINRLVAGTELLDARGTALAIVGLGLLMIIIRSLSRILIFWPGRQVETGTKSFLFSKTLRLTERFYAAHGMGDLISRLANDVGQLRAFYAFGLLQVLNVAFLMVFTIAKMASVHLTLTVLSLLPLVVMLAIMRFAMPRMHTYSRDNQQALGALTNRVTEAFVNVHVIQANAATGSFTQRAEVENQAVFATAMKMVYIRMAIFPLMTCLSGLAQLVVLFYGGSQVIAGKLSVGDILAFNVYIGLLTFPLSAMGIILSLLQRARTALVRVGEIDRAPPEGAVVRPSTARAVTAAVTPLLVVKGLSFSYPGAASETLSGIDFSIKEGQRIGLFGRIGTGKSTLFQILTCLQDAPPGCIYLRGRDLTSLEPSAVRRQLGFATQQVHMFSDTIRANLAFGITPEPPLEALREAARKAQILTEIEAFEHGWETEIGERGVRLSGGQKQRLALARLLLRAPPLLLLDDVLSAVDHATEQRLLQEFYQLGSAMLLASHRGSALERCDEILILEAGRIVARGPFMSLVKSFPDLANPV